MIQAAAVSTLVLLAAAGLLAFVRLARGPSLADRVVALDLIGTVVAGSAAVVACLSDDVTYLRIAIVAVLVAFLGTVAFALSIERGGAP